jgi:hypothetical protein
MAQPIELKIAPRDPKKELLVLLERAPAEHAAALLDGYDLIQQMHEHGVFELARGLLGAKDKIVESAAEGANSGEAVRAMRNAVILAKTLGSIDPVLLQSFSTSIAETLGDAKSAPANPPGTFSLLGSFLRADQRRALAFASSVFGRFGARLKGLGNAGVNG